MICCFGSDWALAALHCMPQLEGLASAWLHPVAQCAHALSVLSESGCPASVQSAVGAAGGRDGHRDLNSCTRPE